MGLLTVCAQHYEGLAWLIGFYALLCYLPIIQRLWGNPESLVQGKKIKHLEICSTSKAQEGQDHGEQVSLRNSPLAEGAYLLFFSSILFVGGTLPCGRFYYEGSEGFFGNFLLRLSYEYLYVYLGCLSHLVERLESWYLALPRWASVVVRNV